MRVKFEGRELDESLPQVVYCDVAHQARQFRLQRIHPFLFYFLRYDPLFSSLSLLVFVKEINLFLETALRKIRRVGNLSWMPLVILQTTNFFPGFFFFTSSAVPRFSLFRKLSIYFREYRSKRTKWHIFLKHEDSRPNQIKVGSPNTSWTPPSLWLCLPFERDEGNVRLSPGARFNLWPQKHLSAIVLL